MKKTSICLFSLLLCTGFTLALAGPGSDLNCDNRFDDCGEDEFCQMQECGCCRHAGTCVSTTTECPATCRPVCGCFGVTYRNNCEAAAAFMDVSRPGRCNEVQGIMFVTANELEWPTVPGATSYNVYVDGMVADTESGSPSCQASGLEVGSFSIPEQPDPGELWQIEVTAVLPEGEGPMGMGTLCGNRQAGQPCGN